MTLPGRAVGGLRKEGPVHDADPFSGDMPDLPRHLQIPFLRMTHVQIVEFTALKSYGTGFSMVMTTVCMNMVLHRIHDMADGDHAMKGDLMMMGHDDRDRVGRDREGRVNNVQNYHPGMVRADGVPPDRPWLGEGAK